MDEAKVSDLSKIGAGRRPLFEPVLRQTGPLLRGLTDKVTSLIEEAYVSKADHLLED